MDSYVPQHRDDRPSPYQFRGDTSSGDSYRPPPRDFSFRSEVDSIRDAPRNQSYSRGRGRPDIGRHTPRFNHERPLQRQNGDRPARLRQNFRPRRGTAKRHPPTSDRPLLLNQRETTPERLDGMGNGEARFNAWENLSDSQEEEMDIESSASDDERPTKKARMDNSNTQTPEPAKWSNPDPYYALPPIDESHGKRKDVVRVLRKAKISGIKSAAAIDENADFISFGMNDESASENNFEQDSSSEDPDNVSQSAFRRSRDVEIIDAHTAGPGPPPPVPSKVKEALEINVWPPPPPPPDVWRPPPPRPPHGPAKFNTFPGNRNASSQPTSQKRKRNESELSDDSMAVLDPEWAPRPSRNTMPWFNPDVTKTESCGMRLHKEICDFYDHVRPLQFEDELRSHLINRVQKFLDKRYRNAGPKVYSFGSFAAGLYLPNADMDLVVQSADFRESGFPVFQSKSSYRKFANYLEIERIARSGSTMCIPNAKVPIVKYVDSVTGLKVDICFENDTGVIANRTYDQWRDQYPAMTIIVTLVKQFLLMRGLNDVATGGLGGFSVTCLVVSLMQHLPQLQSKTMDPMHNLGELLMEFFDFYGNRFNTTSTGIAFNPAGYFRKHLNTNIKYNQSRPWSLSIIDPNRAQNDIAGGSHNIRSILSCFSEAFRTLQKRMNAVRCGSLPPGDKGSILGVIYAGDYSSFEIQRKVLRDLYQGYT